MKPAQARRPGPEIQRKRKAAEHDLGAGQQLAALLARTDWSRIVAEVALDRPRRPGLADFDVKPAPSIDHMQASVKRRDTTQRFVGYRYNHQDFSGQHHDLFDRRLARPLRSSSAGPSRCSAAGQVPHWAGLDSPMIPRDG